jgi:hypothetical protein
VKTPDDYWPLDCETAALADAANYLEPLEPPANYRNAETIAKWRTEAEAQQLERCSLDPHLARIVCLGYRAPHAETIALCRTEEEERAALVQFWASVAAHPYQVHFVTFNGFRFDFPMVMIRSDYLGLEYQPINVDRYRSPHIDLAQLLTFNDSQPRHSLRFHAKRWGLQIVDEEIDGAAIAGLVKAGEWDRIATHCRNDLDLTQQLAIRYRRIPVAA